MSIELEALNDGTLAYGNGRLVHGMFFKLLKEQDEELSEKLHNMNNAKPYTVSILRSKKLKNWIYYISSGEKVSLEGSFLDENLFKAFYDIVYKYIINKKIISIGNINFIIKNLNLKEVMSIDEMKNKRNIKNNRFALEFLSPTSFRKLGRNYLFPDVAHIFKSYMSRWNNVVGEEYSIDEQVLEIIKENCFCIRHNINTEIMNMSQYKIVGFRGKSYYEIDGKLDENTKDIINNLIGFSIFCGTGYKTTMGMGETKLVK